MICNFRAVATLLVLPFLTAAAMSATIESTKGVVYANHGQGFVSASAGTTLRPGDHVLVRSGGESTILYEDGCRIVVSENDAHTILSRPGGMKDDPIESSPCAAGRLVGEFPHSAVGVGGVGAYAALLLLDAQFDWGVFHRRSGGANSGPASP